MGKRHFNEEWLEKPDANGQKISFWCVKKDEFTATCKLCDTDIITAHMGYSALKQHSEKKKHKGFSVTLEKVKGKDKVEESEKSRDGQKVLQDFFVKSGASVSTAKELSKETSDSSQDKDACSSQASVTEAMWSLPQLVAKAEIIATLQFASQNIPYSSADSLQECYQQQFPDSAIAKHVAISSRKMSYMVSYGLGPYFQQATVKEIIHGNSYFTLHFDETVSAQVKKHMDLLVRFWSEKAKEVKVRYLASIMLGHAKADTVVHEIMKTLEKLALPLKLILSLGMDGPNVNKSILGKLDDKKKERGFKPLVRCPVSCLIHACHNSFRKGLKQYGDNAEELCMNLYYFFKNNPCRRENLFEMEESLDLEELVLLRHTQSRWLSLIPALQRLTKVKEAVKKLIEDIGRNDKNIGKNERYLAIKKGLESKEISVEIEFLLTIKPVFDEFMTKFQREEPMIHLLYANSVKLLKTTMSRLLKEQAYVDKAGDKLKAANVDEVAIQLTSDKFSTKQGQNVTEALKKLSDGSARKAVLGMKMFYKTVIKYLQQMLPLDSVLLKSLSCLNPREQRGPNSMQHCMVVAQNMPSLSEEEQVSVGDKWAHYMEVEIKEEYLHLRVDHFWNKVFGGIDTSGDKFIVLPKMVKCALALCHSNADVERSLSVNKRMLTKMNTRMSAETIVGLRSTKAVVQEYGHASKVPITIYMVKAVQNSYKLYSQHMREEQDKKKTKEKEKEHAEACKRKQSELKKEEKQLHERLEQLTSEHTAVEEALQRAIGYVEEGGEKIKKALAKQDMMEVEAGYKLVEFGKDKQTEATSKISKIMGERNKVERELFKLTGTKKSKK